MCSVWASDKLNFGLSEKHTKFENLPHGFDKSANLLIKHKRQNHEEDFFKLSVLLKKSKL